MLRYIWRKFLADRVSRSVATRITPDLEQLIAQSVAARAVLANEQSLAAIESKMAIVNEQKPWKANLYIPNIDVVERPMQSFMEHSTCSASDFLHPEFVRLCNLLAIPPMWHRKYWEWGYILHTAIKTGAVGPGRRALGFAVGSEPLPSAFANMGSAVMATDAPPEVGIAKGWQKGGEHASRVDDLFKPEVVDRSTFDAQVQFAPCDMTQISDDLTGFDFCWSSCSFEHLGNLNAGANFVVESVEKTLRPGGVACHTTEFNLSSNIDTVEAGDTVLYRKRDILDLIDRLERRGHTVEPFSIAPDTHVLDFFVDTPPYQAPPHLKLQLLGYISTSVGLVIRRGP